MSNQNNAHELIRQNEQIVKKSQKHEANLQKNSTLYFQIGLIVCLLAAFGLLEMKFEKTVPKVYGTLIEEPGITYINVPIIKPETPVYNEPIKRKAVKQPLSYEEVPDDTPEEIFKETFIEPTIDVPIFNPDAIPTLEKKPEDPENVPFFAIQNAPIYPGCENAKDNSERKKCMSQKITKLIQRKFDGSDIAANYGLTGKQKIDVQFTIDKTGRVTNIKTRAPHPKLEEEAIRVVNFIPEMTPGKQRDTNVGVIYNLPIVFQVQ
ncbi:energy transducer TonB [Algibacter sp. PT7-4]|uniref:energy transducer TonB n=1 Tax=Algibacter ulvanivorans TaxID=3400999 RepID=UPI003AAC5891